MSHEEIRKIASGNGNKSGETINADEKLNSKEEKQVEKVLDISNDFIYNFCKTASKEDREWVKQNIAQCILEHGEDKYFPKSGLNLQKNSIPS